MKPTIQPTRPANYQPPYVGGDVGGVNTHPERQDTEEQRVRLSVPIPKLLEAWDTTVAEFPGPKPWTPEQRESFWQRLGARRETLERQVS